MKKWIAVILCFSLSAALWGCNHPQGGETVPTDSGLAVTENSGTQTEPNAHATQSATDPVTEPATEPSVETTPTEPIVEPVAPSTIAVVLEPAVEETLAEDGSVIFRYQSQNVSIHMPNKPAVAGAITEYFEIQLYKIAETAAKVRGWADEAYNESPDWTAYSCGISYVPQRLDNAVISLSGTIWDYAGGSHPNSTGISVNFDAETGNMLALEDVLTDESMAQALHSMVMDGLRRHADGLDLEESPYAEGYEDIVAEHFDLSSVSSGSWYFTDTGMTFYFSPYEIGPYALDMVEVELTYQQLQGALKSNYMPRDMIYSATLSIGAAREDQISTSTYRQIIPVTLYPKGERVAIFSSTTLYNVEITQGDWTEENQFVPQKTILVANSLTEDDLILISADIPDTAPNLRITTQISPTESRTYFISQSGKDGSILLLENVF